jgi:tRNA G26 N,N-dimethylase Trm1
MNLTPSHQDHPLHAHYVAMVAKLEEQGCTTSDAQGVADATVGKCKTCKHADLMPPAEPCATCISTQPDYGPMWEPQNE